MILGIIYQAVRHYFNPSTKLTSRKHNYDFYYLCFTVEETKAKEDR